MPKRAKALTALEVSRLSEPKLHFVGTVPGLALRITGDGKSLSKYWLLRTMVGTKRCDIGIGSYPSFTLSNATAEARRLKNEISQGIDPIVEKRKRAAELINSQRNAVTFDECVERFLAAKSPEWTNAKHVQQWHNTLKQYASPVIGNRSIADIVTADVLEVLNRDNLWLEKTETATRVRQRVESVIAYSVQAGLRPEGLNPARREALSHLLPASTRIKKVQHFPALPYEDMYRFTAALRKKKGVGARALEFAILTGLRSGSVRDAQWSEIDFDKRLWTVPAQHMKTGKEHRVPLSNQAIKLLSGLAGGNRPDDLIFSSTKGKPLSDGTLSKAIEDLHAADLLAGSAGFFDPKQPDRTATTHGFRSTLKDWATEQTAHSSETIEQALAHTAGDALEQAYRRGDLFERRVSLMQEWADYCETKRCIAANTRENSFGTQYQMV
jgi:integrase